MHLSETGLSRKYRGQNKHLWNYFLPFNNFSKATVKFNIKVSHSSALLMFPDRTKICEPIGLSELNINPEVSEKRFKETLISLNHNNRKRSGFKVDQLECNYSSLYIKSKTIIPA